MATQSTVKVLTQGLQLGTSATAEYTVPTNTTTVIKKVTVTNSTGLAATVSIYKVVSGGTPTAANIIISARNIPSGADVELYSVENHVLNSGDAIYAESGTASALTFHMSGIELQ